MFIFVCFSDVLYLQVNLFIAILFFFFFRSLGRSVQQMLLPCSTLGQIFCKPLAALEVSFQFYNIYLLFILLNFSSSLSVIMNKIPICCTGSYFIVIAFFDDIPLPVNPSLKDYVHSQVIQSNSGNSIKKI